MQYYSLKDVILPLATKKSKYEVLTQDYPGKATEPYCLSPANPMQISKGRLNVIFPQTSGMHTTKIQLINKSGIRITELFTLQVYVQPLSTESGIGLDLRWDNTTMESGGQFFLDYDKEVIFGRTLEPYLDIRNRISIDTSMATITDVGNKTITGTVYRGYEGQRIRVTVDSTSDILTAKRNRPLRLSSGSFSFTVLDANEFPVTSFEAACLRVMIDNFFSRNTA